MNGEARPDEEYPRRPTPLQITGLLVLAGGLLIQGLFPPPAPARRVDPASDEQLRKLVAGMNRQLPMEVDEGLVLLYTSAEEATLVYEYRYLWKVAEWTDGDRLRDELRPQILATACNTPRLCDDLLAAGIALRYVFRDRHLVHITSVEVKPGDCS